MADSIIKNQINVAFATKANYFLGSQNLSLLEYFITSGPNSTQAMASSESHGAR